LQQEVHSSLLNYLVTIDINTAVFFQYCIDIGKNARIFFLRILILQVTNSKSRHYGVFKLTWAASAGQNDATQRSKSDAEFLPKFDVRRMSAQLRCRLDSFVVAYVLLSLVDADN